MGQESDLELKTDSVGSSGTIIQAGIFREEYLTALEFSGCAYENYDKMRRQDYEIKRVLRAVQTPILSANFDFMPLDPNDEEQLKQAQFKNNVFKCWTTKKWREQLQDILSYLTFGFAVFEPTIHVVEDKDFGTIQTLKTLGFRKQDTIEEWKIDEDGQIEYVRQNIIGTDHDRDVKLTGDEIIVFTNDKEGDNYEGISIIRTAYGPYKRKLLYEKIDMIGIEKMAIGTPTIFANAKIWNDPKELPRIQEVLRRYSSHEKQYMILPESLKDGGFEIIRGQYDSTSVRNSISQENLNITKSVLASFLDIGTLSRGGDKQTEQLVGFFLNSINNIGEYICEQIDPLVHQIYVMNFGEPDVKLGLKCSGINKKDLSQMSTIIKTLVDAGALTPDDGIEFKLRSELDLPQKEEQSDESKGKEPERENPKPEEDEKKEKVIENSTQHEEIKFNENGFFRDLTQFESESSLKRVKAEFESQEEELKKTIRQNFNKMKGKYRNDLRNALNQSNKDRATMSIKVGFSGQFTKDVRDILKETVETGKQQMAKELSAEKRLASDDGIVKNLASRINFTSDRIVNDIQDRFQNASTLVALDGLAAGLSDEEIIDDVDSRLNDLLGSAVIFASIGATINRFLNNGRNNFAIQNKDLIQGFQYSAIIDNTTTDICRSLDGQTFKVGDVPSLDLRPPLHWNCRSILVPILMTEGPIELGGLEVVSIEKGGKLIPRREILKQKQFENKFDFNKELQIDYEKMPVGSEVVKDGKDWVKDADGMFRLK